jgi:hypothetical protein
MDNIYEKDGPWIKDADRSIRSPEWSKRQKDTRCLFGPNYAVDSSFDFEDVSAQPSIDLGAEQLQNGEASIVDYSTPDTEGTL